MRADVIKQEEIPILLKLPSYAKFVVYFSLLSLSHKPSKPKLAVLEMKSDHCLILLQRTQSYRFSISLKRQTQKERAAFVSYRNSSLVDKEEILAVFARSKVLRHIDIDTTVFLQPKDSSEFYSFSFIHPEEKNSFLSSFGAHRSRQQFFSREDAASITVEKELGSGHFGSVHLIRHKEEEFAMKVLDLKESSLYDFNCNERIILEELSRRKSDYLENLQASFVIENQLILVVDYCDGGDLFHFIKKQRALSEESAVFILEKVLKGLEVMHALGIAHRDIKPENVMLTSSGGVKLIDFGLSTHIESKSFDVLGTIYYQSPEMLRGHGHGLSSDFWQIGVLFFEMLFGRPLFYNSESYLVEKKIVSQSTILIPIRKAEPLSSVTRDFLYALLMREPSDRAGYKGGVAEILAHCMFEEFTEVGVPVGLSGYLSTMERKEALATDGTVLQDFIAKELESNDDVKNIVQVNCVGLNKKHHLESQQRSIIGLEYHV